MAEALLARIGSEGTRAASCALASQWHLAFLGYVLSSRSGPGRRWRVGLSRLTSPWIMLLLPAADFFLCSLLDHFFPSGREATDGRRGPAGLQGAARILLFILAFSIGRVWGNFFARSADSRGPDARRRRHRAHPAGGLRRLGAIKAALARYMPAEEEGLAGGDEVAKAAHPPGTVMRWSCAS